ncbi:MAG: inosine-5-monophosphate dehydrogenase [Rhodospirillaceae bacterium]|nr:inosine-5-monophosphate dehydrogenase [Rhodospirillaceae bacterium]|tara:strand:+ start:99 stop:533 length:435 start_codon:yes stop_codon:yes gene_type:complete
MTVRVLLKSKGDSGEVISVAPETTVEELAGVLVRYRIGAAMVRDSQGIVKGLISERDVIHGIAEHGKGTTQLPVSQFMTKEVVTCSPDDTIDSVMETMTTRRFRHVPVMEGGSLVGVISIGDVVKYRIEQTEREAQHLREYITA